MIGATQKYGLRASTGDAGARSPAVIFLGNPETNYLQLNSGVLVSVREGKKEVD